MNTKHFLRALSLILALCMLLTANAFAVFAVDTARSEEGGEPSAQSGTENAFDNAITYANSVANGVDGKYIDASRQSLEPILSAAPIRYTEPMRTETVKSICWTSYLSVSILQIMITIRVNLRSSSADNKIHNN